MGEKRIQGGYPVSGNENTGASIYRSIRKIARDGREYSPELFAAVLELSKDPEIAGIADEDERGRAMLRRLHESGADGASKALRELYMKNTDPRGEGYDNPVRYRLPDIAKKLGYESVRDMLDGSAGWEKVPYDRYADIFGKDADTVRDILKSATHDYFMNVKLPEERKNITHDGTASAFFARLLAPRSVEAAERGEEPSAKDYALDAGEVVASFLTPFGRVASGLSKLPKAGRVFEGLGRVGKLPFAGKIIANLPDAALAPFAMEAADAIAYGDENEGRGAFELSDPMESTLFNAAIPFFAKRGLDMLSDLSKKGGNLAADKEKGAIEAMIKEAPKEAAEAAEEVLPETAGKATRFFAALKKAVPKGAKSSAVAGLKKLGMNGAGKVATEMVPAVKDFVGSLEEGEEANREERRKKRTSSMARQVMEGAALTDEDRKFLAYIEEHPESVIYGMPFGVDRDRFNTWLMTRGRDLRRPGWSSDSKG